MKLGRVTMAVAMTGIAVILDKRIQLDGRFNAADHTRQVVGVPGQLLHLEHPENKEQRLTL